MGAIGAAVGQGRSQNYWKWGKQVIARMSPLCMRLCVCLCGVRVCNSVTRLWGCG